MKVNAESIKALNNITKGQVLTPESDNYDESRAIWNGMFDKKPALISRCETDQDVIASVNFARENNLLVAVKGGGHNSAGTASCDDGIMIDLSLMQNVEVDKLKGTAKAQGGCLLGEVDKATQEHGLAVSAGIISHTGVGGLTLGGGLGWISRKHGLSVDNLISADVVTADGRLVKASKDENTDLFWAIRGGGGNFGVVTNFEFQCADIGTEVYSGPIVKKIEDAKDYFKFHREFVKTLPDEMSVWTVMRHAPPLPFIPEEYHGKLVLLIPFVWLGDAEEGERIMQPVRDFCETIGDGSAMHPWVAWQAAFDGLVMHGARNYWKSHQIKELSDGFIDEITKFAISMPSDECEVFIPHMEGAPSRVPADATAYSHRKAPFILNIHTRWQSPSDDEKCLKWARDFHDATRAYSDGVYVNFVSDTDDRRIREAYRPEVWDRLVKAKSKWDPGNLFRMNMNIRPNGV